MTGSMMRARDRVIIGDPARVRAVLEDAHARGTLVAFDPPTYLPDGTVRVRARLLEPVASAPVPARRGHRNRAILVGSLVTAGTGTVVGVAWAVIELVQAVVAAFPVLLGLGVVVIVLFGLLVGSGKCPGIHCRGCRG